VKSRLASVVLILGLLITGITAIVAYLARTVLDEEAFSGRVVAALERPAASAFVAQRIADGVVAANRDLTGIKPVIATFAQAMVNSSPFRALVRRAAREAHHVLFSQGAENAMLSVPDVGVLLRGTLETVSPELAKKVPADIRTVIDTRIQGAVATRIVGILRDAIRVRLVARFGMLFGLLLVGLGVALAPRRRQALLNAGTGLLAVAAVLGLIGPMGRAAITGAFADPQLSAALGDVWSAFASGLTPWALGLGIVALIVVAGAGALLDRDQLREAVRRALAEVGGPQATPRREAARLVLVLVLGAFAVADPLDTLATLTVAAGALLLVAAVFGVVGLIAPHGLATSDTTPVRFNPALSVALAVVILVAAGMGSAALALRFQPKAASATGEGILECNGAIALCDRTFDRITLAGAHNAMGSADNPQWLFPNQDANLPKLLHMGVRAFMLDVWNGHLVGDRVKTDFANEDDRRKYETAIGPEAFAAAMRIRDRMVGEGGPVGMYMCHGLCELGAMPFDTALAQFRQFLVQNPNEVVLVILEDYVAPAEVDSAVQRTGLLPYLYRGPVRGPFPTLRELIATNQRLFVMGEHETDSIPWYYPAYQVMQETPYTFHSPEDFNCKPNRGEPGNPILLVNHWIESTPAPRPSNAMIVNAEPVLLARARECRRVRGKLPNVIAVDFAATGDVVQAAAVLNGLVPPPAPGNSP
jgi:hypothetical protein